MSQEHAHLLFSLPLPLQPGGAYAVVYRLIRELPLASLLQDILPKYLHIAERHQLEYKQCLPEHDHSSHLDVCAMI